MATKKQYEQHLNEFYADIYSEEEAVDNFIYLTSKLRDKGNRTTEGNVRNCYNNHTLGSLHRRLDPISFNVGYEEYNR